MNTKKLFMLLAAMLLGSASTFAQSGNNEPLKGDVNGDGKVDVADITAIIKIMKDGGGTAEEVTHYYYAGWTLPTVDNVDKIINETYPTSSENNTQHAAGKKTTNPSTFSLASVNLYNSAAKTNYYVLVPIGHAIYDTVFNIQMGTASFTSQGTITVGGQTHTIYKSVDTTRNIGAIEIAPTYYTYVGTDPNELIAYAATGALKENISNNLPLIDGIKTYTSIPSSLEPGITINAGGNYVYVIAPTETLNHATIYLVNQSNMAVGTETLGTFMIGTTEYKVECTPSEVGTILTAWKN